MHCRSIKIAKIDKVGQTAS